MAKECRWCRLLLLCISESQLKWCYNFKEFQLYHHNQLTSFVSLESFVLDFIPFIHTNIFQWENVLNIYSVCGSCHIFSLFIDVTLQCNCILKLYQSLPNALDVKAHQQELNNLHTIILKYIHRYASQIDKCAAVVMAECPLQ